MRSYGIATKSDSYIFAIERNSIPASLGPYLHTTSPFGDQQSDGGQYELLVIPENKRPLQPEQIEHSRTDSVWKRARWLLYSVFWLGWSACLLIAVLIAASHSNNCLLTTREWWKDTIIYEIWTLSYEDSNSDGVGDLNGMRQRLDHLQKLGIGAIFMRPVIWVESTGLGVIGHTELSSQIGSFEEIAQLVREAHNREIRILIDFPLLVTSQAHSWFDKSALASRPENSHFADFYLWRRGIPDSEHISAYKGSTLKYFHVKSRPDLPVLAWHKGNVTASVNAALSFWIKLGIDGFHLSSIDYLCRSPDGKHADWDGISKKLESLRTFVQEKSAENDRICFLFTSHEHLAESTKRQLVQQGGLDAVINTELRKLALGNKVCSKSEASLAECANEIVADLLLFHQQISPPDHSNDAASVWPIWAYGSAFTARLASRVGGRAVAELLLLLELMLPGTPLVYYGEETGQSDCRKCKFPQRGPLVNFEEDHVLDIDFLNGTILPQSKQDKLSQQNLLRNFKRLLRFRRRSKTLATGKTYITKPMEEQAFALCRYLEKAPEDEEEENGTGAGQIYGDVVIYAVNFGPSPKTVSLVDLPPFHGPSGSFLRSGKVLAVGANSAGFRVNYFIDLDQRKLRLGPVQAVVIQAPLQPTY